MAAASAMAAATASRSSRSTAHHRTARVAGGAVAPAPVRPRRDRRLAFEQMIDEVAAGKSGAARDQRDGPGTAGVRRGARRTGRRSRRGSAGSLSLIGRHHHSFCWYQATVSRSPGSNGTCGAPAEPLQLRRVERIAAVVAGAIGDRTDQRFRLAGQIENPPGEIDVEDVIAAADVVDLARRAAIDQQIDGAAMIADVQPVALLQPVAIERHRDVVDRIRDEQRDQLFGKVVRPVVVRRPRDRSTGTS